MITIRPLNNCRLDQILKAWNKGFEGYFVPINMTLDSFLSRMVHEGISSELSIVAFDKEEPVGIILNGFRDIKGTKHSWNGGTGVAPAYRRKGVGRKLMDETLRIYEAQDVSVATLEAIAENHKAISLYESCGYQVTGKVAHYSLTGPLQLTDEALNDTFTVTNARIGDVSALEIFNPSTTWQTQIQSIYNGEAHVLYGHNGNPSGYSLFKRIINDSGNETHIVLYQLEIASHVSDKQKAAAQLLKSLFGQSNAAKTIVNYPLSSNEIVELFERLGFEKKVEQVVMAKEL
ncbi:GNAT family N-acetyltransferase [Heyndrickxia acidicola]|uniref:GNAT family N-acetyltransferase n=1 Tax=Heyndrickxia acidicola TaxID=209389 RepID=A0ABU6MAR3_9BACI|nr:GNAT family N-acetyltransferase [Heyndrickxia acidicola]MED1201762.1 GNAT family N-acetyltransferase [Heyndrickxia acidicola]